MDSDGDRKVEHTVSGSTAATGGGSAAGSQATVSRVGNGCALEAEVVGSRSQQHDLPGTGTAGMPAGCAAVLSGSTSQQQQA
jgi:hypothetical protein